MPTEPSKIYAKCIFAMTSQVISFYIPFKLFQSNSLFSKPQINPSVICFDTYARPQFQSYGVETLHVASSMPTMGVLVLGHISIPKYTPMSLLFQIINLVNSNIENKTCQLLESFFPQGQKRERPDP